MAGVGKKVTVDDKEFVNKINKLKRWASNPERTLQRVSIRMYQDVIQHFRKEEGSQGAWKELKESTLARRRNLSRQGTMILQDTGRLKGSISRASDNKNAVVGTNVEYAPTHQFGRGNIPMRDFLWLSADGKAKVIEEFRKDAINAVS